jgi:hypothetical protein
MPNPIPLYDPIGAAEDIGIDADKKYTEFQSLVSAIQTGSECPEELEHRSETDLKQSQALYTHASILYKMFYDRTDAPGTDASWQKRREDKKFMRMSEHLVSEDFFKKMLGVDERADLKNQINQYRDRILAFINSDYYTTVLEDYRTNTPFRRELGIYSVTAHIQRFAYDPSLADRAIDSTDTEDPVNQAVEQYLGKVYNGTDHPVHRLLAEPFDIQDVIDEYAQQQRIMVRGITINDNAAYFTDDFIERTNIIWGNMFTIYTVWAENIAANPTPHFVEMNKSWFNKMTFERTGGQWNWVIKESNLREVLEKNGYTYENPIQRGKQVDKIPASPAQQKLAQSLQGTKAEIKGIIRNPELEVKIDPNSPNAPARPKTGFDKFFMSRGFIAFSGLISVGNMMVAISEFDDENWLTRGSSRALIASAVAEILTYGTYCARIHLATTKTAVLKWKAAQTFLGHTAIALLAISNLLKGVNAIFNKGNTKMGIEYIAVGAILTTALIVNIKLSAAFWPAAILFAIGAGLSLLLNIRWSTTPLEDFFGSSILSPRAMRVIANWNSLSAKDIHNQLLAQSNEIVSDKNENLRDMEVSLDRLMTFFISTEVDQRKTKSELFIGTNSSRINIQDTDRHHRIITELTMTIRPIHTDADAKLKAGLWIWMRKGNTSTIEAINLEAYDMDNSEYRSYDYFYKTREGYKVVFDLERYMFEFEKMSSVKAFFYHHFILSDGTIFPGNNSDEYYLHSVTIKGEHGTYQHRYDREVRNLKVLEDTFIRN